MWEGHIMICAQLWLCRDMAVRGFDNHPLFQQKNGTPFSRQALVERIKTAQPWHRQE